MTVARLGGGRTAGEIPLGVMTKPVANEPRPVILAGSDAVTLMPAWADGDNFLFIRNVKPSAAPGGRGNTIRQRFQLASRHWTRSAVQHQ